MRTETRRPVRSVLISGAGPAGQCLAYWLTQFGFAPTVVERAPVPRLGGYAIDLRGAAVTVVEQMGIIDRLRASRVDLREIVMFDDAGDVVWRTDGNFGAGTGDVEILRSDLTRIIMDAAKDRAEYLFGDSITNLAQDEGGVAVDFRFGASRRFDLVVGCDGLHSNVRSLAFGAESDFTKPLGRYVAVFRIENQLHMDRQMWMCTVPGAITGWLQYGADKDTYGCIILSMPPDERGRGDAAAQMQLVRSAMSDRLGWKNAALVDAMGSSTDFYFDEVTQIRMPSWSKGRVALVGDAAYAPTLLSGQGTSIAVVGAYVLAGELMENDGDHRAAFSGYEAAMRGYVEQNQQLALDSKEWFVPETWEEMRRHNDALRNATADAADGSAEQSYGDQTQKAARAIALKHYA